MAQGLRGALPEQGTYGMEAVGQVHGVYVAREPDERGVWAQEDAWDVWKIVTAGLTWEHDRLNPGCWVLTAPVLPDALRLHFSASFEE